MIFPLLFMFLCLSSAQPYSGNPSFYYNSSGSQVLLYATYNDNVIRDGFGVLYNGTSMINYPSSLSQPNTKLLAVAVFDSSVVVSGRFQFMKTNTGKPIQASLLCSYPFNIKCLRRYCNTWWTSSIQQSNTILGSLICINYFPSYTSLLNCY